MPPAVDRALLRSLADLARLHVPVDREPELVARLQRILEAFAALREVATEGVPAEPWPLPLTAPLREDVAEPPMDVSEVLANARRTAAESFLVPRVVDA